MLKATDLECVRGERCLFRGLGFALGAGECLHVAGDNGAGKTSLLRILAGLLAPTHGEVRWDGRDILRAREEYGADLAFVGHLNGIKDELTVLENLRLEAALRGRDASEAAALDALEAVGIAELADLTVRQLSQGQKRRTALARLCGAARARIWILDEPFNALDAGAVAILNGLLERQLSTGGSVVLTAHQAPALPAAARRIELRGSPEA